MGMGEPLDNLEHLVRAIRVMSNFPGLGIKNITVSTVGLAPQVYSLLRALPRVPSSRLTRRPPSRAAAPHGHPCHSQGPGRFPSS